MTGLRAVEARRFLEGGALPTHAQAVEMIRLCESGGFRLSNDAEPTAGWLAAAEHYGVFQLLNVEFVDALAAHLRPLAPVLEVAAGAGRLASALRARGIEILPTDPSPVGIHVEALDAADALARHGPRVVLVCWPPVDAGVEDAVLGCSRVRHIFVVSARQAHEPEGTPPWRRPGWGAAPCENLDAHSLCRQDFFESPSADSLVRHSRVWRLCV